MLIDDATKAELMESFDEAYTEVELCLSLLTQTQDAHAQKEQLNRLFRAIHSVKGNAGMVGLNSIVEFAHAVEEVASSLRSGRFGINPDIGETLLIAMDRLNDLHQQELYQKHFEHLRTDILTPLYHAMAIAKRDEIDVMTAQTLESLGAGIKSCDSQVFTHKEECMAQDHGATLFGNEPAASGVDNESIERDLLFFQQTALELDFLEETWGGRSIQLFDWAMKMNGISGNTIDPKQLAAAIYLHDIGMTLVPRSDWPADQLEPPEMNHPLLRHCDWGADYLARIPGWEEAATIIREHHEHVDGSGYPKGLKGSAIHPGAKILCILDTFFTMTNGSVDASHRKSTIRALSAINARIDTVFEGMWVQCFNHVMREELRAGYI